ncbi:MAG: serine/threonine protein kinase, partial [Candidatus Viridilinea halotolerans]
MLAPDTLLRERYRITYVVDQQPDGLVYRAFDSETTRRVLLCALSQPAAFALGDVGVLATQVVAARGPRLLALDNHFAHEDCYYLVCGDPEGHDLERVARGRGSPLPEAEVLGLVAQLCATVAQLHQHAPPLLLGDLRPSDLWSDDEQRLWLTPFALVRRSRLAGSPYCAPELTTAEDEPTPASDVYALGALCYQLLTGWAPPAAEQRAVGVPLNPPRTLNAHISALVERVVLRSLAPEPSQRYPQVHALHAALTSPQHSDGVSATSSPLTSPPPASPPPASPPLASPPPASPSP